jgi:hypothetical protein
MPRIPVYDTFQVNDGNLPQARIAAPDDKNYASDQIQNLARGMTSIGNEVGRIAESIATKANQARVDASVTDYVRVLTDLDVEASQLRGIHALQRPDEKSLQDEFMERAGKLRDEIKEKLANDLQKTEFSKHASRMEASLYSKLGSYMVSAQREYTKDQRTATVNTAIYRARALWSDPEAVAQSEQAIRSTIEMQLVDDGLHTDPVIREERMVKALSPLHAGVLTGMIDNHRIDQARQYYEKNSASMSLQDRDVAQRALEYADFEEKTQGLADRIYQSSGSIDVALAEARRTLTGKEEDAVVNRLKTLFTERESATKKDMDDAASEAWKLAFNGVRPSPSLFARMDGKDAIAVQTYLDKPKREQTDIVKWVEFADLPVTEMAKLSGNDVLRMYGEHFTDADVRNAQNMVNAAKGIVSKDEEDAANQEGLDLLTKNELITTSARMFGILPRSGKSPTVAQETSFFEYTNKIQQRIQEFESTGKKATVSDLRNIITTASIDKAMVDEWGRDPEKYVISMSAKDVKKSYVIVNDSSGKAIRVRRTDIPVDKRIEIIDALRRNGSLVTEKTIADFWINWVK